ncbi:methyltransferase [Polyangium aurulentum]|uniref:methyltransferase n=1 Tax=Polyangium aurulentum TaxID=2567896 RepID=UPI0010AE46F0|nr:methyltransferase [Polyangium aurulentum]UQA62769.1 SAM-dependent methyltransferase [Polyangium aurulentum]
MPLLAAQALERALSVLVPALDIVEGRVDDDTPPAWCEARGWTGFLLSLSDDDLARCESAGLSACIGDLAGAPPSLTELALAAAEAARLPRHAALPLAPPADQLQSVPARKRLQLESLLGAVAPMAARARRIVDVGAGRGHFTRIAAESFDVDALGIEREPARVSAAAALAEGTRALFVASDALREDLAFAPDDLLVGLHACGELGDRMVLSAANAPCDLVLVSCCLQKIGGPARAPLSQVGARAGLVLRREALGLTNLTARPVGVESSLEDMLSARGHRHALLRLLRARGLDVSPGEEMRGINRRRARFGLGELAARALSLRGMAPATEAEIREHERAAHLAFSRMRRLSLPRSMLARLTEVAVVLDRAAALEERGHEAQAAIVFDPDVSPRNIAILARAPVTRAMAP